MALSQGRLFVPYRNLLAPTVTAVAVFDPTVYPDPLVGQLSTPVRANAIVMDGLVAYVADAQGVKALDFSDPNPANWSIRDELALPAEAHDLVMVDDHLYVANGTAGVKIVDASDPDDLTLVATASTGVDYSYRAVAVSGATMFVGDKGYVQLADLTQPATPVFASSRLLLPDCVQGIAISGAIAFVAAGEAGVARVDCSDPDDLELLGLEPPPASGLASAHQVVVAGDVLLTAENTPLRCLDADALTNRLYALGQAATLAHAHDIAVMGSYAYVANGDGYPTKMPGSCGVGPTSQDYSLEIIDISDPDNPSHVSDAYVPAGDLGVLPFYAVKVRGKCAYLGTISGGFVIFDVSNAQNPTYLSGGYTIQPFDPSQRTVDIELLDNLALFASEQQLTIFDVTDPEYPVWLDAIFTTALAVCVEGDYAYLAAGASGLTILDISDTQNVSLVGTWQQVGCAVMKLAVRDGIVYAVEGQARSRLTILDVTNPASPALLASVALPPGPQRIALTGNHAYVANYNAGVSVIDVADPADPVLLGTIATTSTVMSACTDADYLYLAEGWNRMTVAARQCGDWDASLVRYENRSTDTELDYGPYTPYSAITLDYSGDGRRDLMLTLKDSYGRLYRQQSDLSANGVPIFDDRTPYDFASGQAPQTGLRGLSAADYDNDGHIDIFAAAASGARLYHNNNGVFADSAAAVGLTAFATDSWAGAWGDYDRDGRTDLYICRGATQGCGQNPTPTCLGTAEDYLLRNATREDGSFVDVTDAAGIDIGSANASVAAAWADADGDKDLDLFVGDLSSYNLYPTCRLYINDGAGVFTEDFSDRFPYDTLYGTSAVSWADLDNDGDLDLALGNQLDDPKAFLNDGTGHFTELTGLDTGGQPTLGLKPLDHDLDGRIDLLALPQNVGAHPWLFGNKLIDTGLLLKDESATVALNASTGRIDGVVAADFNGDGDSDLYFGRPQTDGTYYYRAVHADRGDAPAGDWVGVRLLAGGANNRAAIGAKVVFRIGSTFQQAHTVDGGNGRGGQADSTLICGLGQRPGTVEAVVTWPGGYQQTATLTRNAVTNIADATVPTISSGSVTSTYIAHPGGRADWVFTWDTTYSCDPGLDAVRINDPTRPNPPQCADLSSVVLTPDGPDVSAAVTAKAGGGYRHTLTWIDTPCVAPCNYRYTVESAADANHKSVSASQAIAIGVCIP